MFPHGAGAVGNPFQFCIMTENVLAVLGQSHVHFGPLKAVLDAPLQCRPRVFRCLMGLAPVNHDLEWARRLNGFEERKLRGTAEPLGKCGDDDQPESRLAPQRREAETRTPHTGLWKAHDYWPVRLSGTHQSRPGKRDAS